MSKVDKRNMKLTVKNVIAAKCYCVQNVLVQHVLSD